MSGYKEMVFLLKMELDRNKSSPKLIVTGCEPKFKRKPEAGYENAMCVWDFTISYEEVEKDYNVIIKQLKEHCKKYCFQLEKGKEDGYLHYQGRLSLKIKLRKPQIIELFPQWRLRATSTVNSDNIFYVMKDDTKVQGPWKDTDEEIYIPRDIREITKLLPWQESMLEIISGYNQRVINVVYDPVGNKGKSTFVRYCGVYRIGRKLPFCNEFRDVMRMVCDMPTSKCYFIDMPRAVNKDRLYSLYGAIEEVKNGWAYDERYHYKEKYFDPPCVILFTNREPDLNMVSMDRWRIWSINDEKELVPYVSTSYIDGATQSVNNTTTAEFLGNP